MYVLKKLVLVAFLTTLAGLGLTGCDDGPFENAGEEIDEAGEEMKDEMDDLKEEVD